MLVATLLGVALTQSIGPLGAEAQRAQDARLEGGSAVPCAVPLAWRVARVDRQFGIGSAEARDGIQAAAELWEAAVGRTLFRHDPANGFPIRVVYDARQAQLQRQGEQEAALDALADELNAERTVLERRDSVWQGSRRQYEARVAEYERRLGAFNDTVRVWNQRGGAPADVGRALEARARVLGEERASLEGEAGRLEHAQSDLLRDQERLNRRVADHRRRVDELAAAYPGVSVQSGLYRESVLTENGRLRSVSREIRVFRFTDFDELVLVVAHELGHALGLGHASDPAAIMSEEHLRGPGADRTARVHGDDLRALLERCPGLGS